MSNIHLTGLLGRPKRARSEAVAALSFWRSNLAIWRSNLGFCTAFLAVLALVWLA
jgi:hypothetical protein